MAWAVDRRKGPERTQKAVPHPLRDAVVRYLGYLVAEQNRSLNTVAVYRKSLEQFLRFNPPPRLAQISLATIRHYKVYLRQFRGLENRPLKATSINTYLIALRGFLKYLAVQEDQDVLPHNKVELLDTGERQVKVLTDEQVTQLLAAPLRSKRKQAVRDCAILELLFSTGARVSELTALNRGQVNLKTREMSIRGKRRKVRVVFITDTAAKALADYVKTRDDHYEPLFIRTAGPKVNHVTASGDEFRLSTRTIWSIVHHYAHVAGLVTDPSPHTLRHTLATTLLRRGADLRSVQEILGHEDVSTTQIYTHVTNPQLKEIHRKYHPRNRR